MDRNIYYPGQVPLSAQFLLSERDKMVAVARFAETVMGSLSVAAGLGCIPTIPTSLSVQVGAGELLTMAALDAIPFGALASDTAHVILKQGFNLDPTTLTLVPPTTNGHAISYLVQVGLSETDGDNVTLPYVNAANPSVPFTGPNNAGTSQPTRRRARLVIQAKPGISAVAGSQVPPPADVGFVPIHVVTVAQGQTSITSDHIVRHPSAPFLLSTLPDVPKRVQSGEWVYGEDAGTKNAMVVTLTPSPADPPKLLVVKKGAVASDDALTIVINGGAAIPITTNDNTAFSATIIAPANFPLLLAYDGTAYRTTNIASGLGGGGSGSPTSDLLNLPIFPEIETANNQFAITNNGNGTLTVAPGQIVVWRGWLKISTDTFGIPARTVATAAGKTYHLRLNRVTGFSLKDVNDLAYNPSSAPETSSAFDTTFDDMLVARIVTDGANVPTTTTLVNKALFSASFLYSTSSISVISGPQQSPTPNGPIVLNTGSDMSAHAAAKFTLNFARAPRMATAVASVIIHSNTTSGALVEAGANVVGKTVTRYDAIVTAWTDYNTGLSNGGAGLNAIITGASCLIAFDAIA